MGLEALLGHNMQLRAIETMISKTSQVQVPNFFRRSKKNLKEIFTEADRIHPLMLEKYSTRFC
jgi:hypothetical protein